MHTTVAKPASQTYPSISAAERLPLSVVLNCSELAVQLSLSWVLNTHLRTHQYSSRALTSWQRSTASQSVTVCPFWRESVCQPFNPDRSDPSHPFPQPVSLKGSGSDEVQHGAASPRITDAIFWDIILLKSTHLFPTETRTQGKAEQDVGRTYETLSVHTHTQSQTHTYTFCHLAFCLLYYWSTSTTISGLKLQLTPNLLRAFFSHLHTQQLI